MPHPDLHTDRRLKTPLYRQLYQRVRDAIAAGRLQPGDRVPSVRSLASELNLSRGTVELAYQVLVSEGYLLARGAAGTVVSPQLLRQQITLAVERRSSAPRPVSESARAAPPPLQLGLPALDAVPTRLWRRLTMRRLRGLNAAALDYPDAQGSPALRNALAAYLGVSRGIACHADQIIITAGYRDALGLICRTLLRPGDRGWFEEPGYFLARDMLRAAGLSLAPVAVDADGLDVAAGRRQAEEARFAVVTPSHQSPSGVSLALPRRLALLEWANDNDAWIIEDDYDSEYRYQGRPIPALKSLDHGGRVLYTGTFSKVLFPGLRLAYLVVPSSKTTRFRDVLRRFGQGCPALPQAVTADFINEGHFARHLKRMRDMYAQRRTYLRDALEAKLGDRLRVDLQAGGMHLLTRFVNNEDDVEQARRAQRRGLGVSALSTWFIGRPDQSGLLLGFTNIASAEEAERLVSELKSALGA
ncbi:MocR-like pyridoxine biosynthesis transcription factor PdxR [Salinisphaera aquimarina]|uniref:PLP-dependent aminotransferase family protein n=1 Tax=Salinisphaera aquimarina TaxID=2094031 RepID=A0ABV7EML1_9GAMM